MAERKERRAAPRRLSSTAAQPKTDKPVEDIRARIEMSAYLKAKARGFQPGYELQDWLEAEREIKRGANGPS